MQSGPVANLIIAGATATGKSAVAKRQRTWFRHLLDAIEVAVGPDDTAETIARSLPLGDRMVV